MLEHSLLPLFSSVFAASMAIQNIYLYGTIAMRTKGLHPSADAYNLEGGPREASAMLFEFGATYFKPLWPKGVGRKLINILSSETQPIQSPCTIDSLRTSIL